MEMKMNDIVGFDIPSDRVVVSTKDLLKALNSVKKVQTKYNKYLLVLNHILLEFKDGTLIITATNREDTKIETVPYFHTGFEFSTCVPAYNQWTKKIRVWDDDELTLVYKSETTEARLFIDMIKIISEDEKWVMFGFDEKTKEIYIYNDNSKTTMKCIDAQELSSARLRLYHLIEKGE